LETANRSLSSAKTLNFEVRGKGEPLILIHGLAGSLKWWSRNVEACSVQFQTFCLDLAGFGGSRRFRMFHLEQAVSSLVDWMDEQEIARASFIGHSMGGIIAARLAADAPSRVNKLVLVDAAFLAFDAGLLKRASGLVRALSRTPRDFFPVLARDSLRAHPISLATATHELLRSDWGRVLTEIKAPTLIVWGDRDTITPQRIGESIHSAIAHSSIVVIEGASHNPMWDQAERFNEVVLNFLVEAPESVNSKT
jgi:pimeloyl-ACP methyl ester carboxylesterase